MFREGVNKIVTLFLVSLLVNQVLTVYSKPLAPTLYLRVTTEMGFLAPGQSSE